MAGLRVRLRSRTLATLFASLGFLILIIGITYFAMLVVAIHFGEPATRAANYYELGYFLSGKLEWYKDARIYGAASLLSALISILFGVHPLARITLPISGASYVVLYFYGDQIREVFLRWARGG